MMTKIQNCNVCGKKDLSELIGFRSQTVCHHFLRDHIESENLYDLALGQCRVCGTVQLTNRVPIDRLKPRYDWLTCTEPEAHLDRLVQTICQLPGITKDSKIGGISFKDDSVLGRFNRLGYGNTWRADPRDDLGSTDPYHGIETVQERFNPESADRLIQKYGKADVFIARHIIEHAYDLHQFINMSKQLVQPEGYIVFEIPDCQRAFDNYDYTTVWEEHTVYFTGGTFRNCFHFNGFSLIHFERMPYATEDSFVGIAQASEAAAKPALVDADLRDEFLRAERFANEFRNKKRKVKEFLSHLRRTHGKIALFGAGHMSCVFLNIFDLKGLIDFVVDDNPHMRGLFMPGSRLPIFTSKALYEQGIKACILTLSPASEEKVINKNQEFLDRGGMFLSVFPGSKWAMNI